MLYSNFDIWHRLKDETYVLYKVTNLLGACHNCDLGSESLIYLLLHFNYLTPMFSLIESFSIKILPYSNIRQLSTHITDRLLKYFISFNYYTVLIQLVRSFKNIFTSESAFTAFDPSHVPSAESLLSMNSRRNIACQH